MNSPLVPPYVSAGDGDPVLMIAPAATSSTVWALHQVPALTTAGYRVLSYDHRGTTDAWNPPEPWRFADLVADAAAVAQRAGGGPCHLVGSSLGAFTAARLAILRPDLVRSLTLLGTQARTPAFFRAQTDAKIEAMRSGEVPARRAALQSMNELFGPITLLDDRKAMEWLELMTLSPVHGEGVARQYEAVLTVDNWSEELDRIECPTQVVGFQRDTLMPPELVREVAEAVPDSEYLEVPDCGHFGFLERPAEINKRLVDFLGRA